MSIPQSPSLSSFDGKNWTIPPIGVVRSAFTEKFGIPRQPGLTPEAKGIVQLQPHALFAAACKELDQFTHIWIIFVFHANESRDWKPAIRPPRLGGNKKVGVLSSRSPHRPNPIGMSVVKLDRIELDHPDGVRLHVSGLDILDGSPVLDIKPYLPYADSIPNANSGWANDPIPKTEVRFTEEALNDIERRQTEQLNLKPMIIEMLELDPRPAFQKRRMPVDDPASVGKRFGFSLFDFDVKWEIQDDHLLVTGVENLVNGKPAKKSKS
jgi:tRNA-Thr(GGU) m(6)t(6)A37 methyltransferase TsaA